jgi:branched-chain amino acid transport system substrate-binding protein
MADQMKLLSKRHLAVLAVLPVLATVAACGSSSSNAASSSSTSGASGSGGSKSEIVLGNVGTYSGPFGAQYTQSLHSLQAWATFTNAHGGLNGHQVKIISKDDANNPSTSLQEVKTLVEGDHVAALVDMMTPGTDGAWATYVKSMNVPVVGGLGLDSFWSTNPDFFNTNVDQGAFVAGQISAAKVYGTKLGVFTCAELASCKSGIPFFKTLADQVGIGFASVQLIASSAVGYTAQCLALKDEGADVLVPELDGPTTRRSVDSCAQQGFTPKVVLAASDIDAQTLSDVHFNGAVGVTVSPLWYGSSALTADWAAAYKAQFPNDVLNGYSTLGWQAGVVLGTALKNAPATVTAQTVLAGLYAQPAKSTYGGWTPPLTYAKGKPTTTSPCLWYVGIQGGQLTAPKGSAFVCSS